MSGLKLIHVSKRDPWPLRKVALWWSLCAQTAMQFGPTLAQRRCYRPDVGPTLAQTILSDLLGCEEGLPIRVTRATEPAHHRAAGLCAVRLCDARLCSIRLGCVEGHPWNCSWEYWLPCSRWVLWETFIIIMNILYFTDYEIVIK